MRKIITLFMTEVLNETGIIWIIIAFFEMRSKLLKKKKKKKKLDNMDLWGWMNHVN